MIGFDLDGTVLASSKHLLCRGINDLHLLSFRVTGRALVERDDATIQLKMGYHSGRFEEGGGWGGDQNAGCEACDCHRFHSRRHGERPVGGMAT